jgi:hypothetical protein
VFPRLEKDPLLGSFKDVLGSGLLGRSSLSPLAGIESSLSSLAALETALVATIVELPALQIPNIAQLVSKPLFDNLGMRNIAASAFEAVRVPSLPSVALLSPALPSAGLFDAFASVKSLLSMVDSHSCVLRSGLALSGFASSVQVLTELPSSYGRQMKTTLAEPLSTLARLYVPPLPPLAGSIGPAMADVFASAGMQRILKDSFAIRPLLAELIGDRLSGVLAGVRASVAWVERLRPSVLADARYAYKAYMAGDREPMKRFLLRSLRLWPVTEDHCQAMAVAMWEGRWEQEADLTDDRSVRKVLCGYARQGNISEYDHEIRGAKIGYIPDGWNQPDPGPGPEEEAISRLLPWVERFETATVRSILRQLSAQERAVVRVWAENHPVAWTVAPTLVHQDPSQGERNRRKLIRLGQIARQRENNRRELP